MNPLFPSFARRAVFLGLFLNVAHAQWYAPEVNYHDPVQRVFPVELARVLAWRENLAGAKIKEVTYTARSTPEGRTEWALRWLGDDNQPWREATVSYAEDLLLTGPGFYREIGRQLGAQTWAGAKFTPPAPAELNGAFWTGLGEMGASRMATLRDAITASSSLSATAFGRTPSRLAGQLLAAAVPGVGGMHTLDSTLAARGAAWLLLSETVEANALPESDRRWAVVLWLARRESAATDLWTHASGVPPETPAGKKAQVWWDVVLRPVSARALVVRAADFDDPVWSMPLLVYAARLKSRPALAVACAEILVDRDEARLLPQHDYAAWISTKGTVETGHVTNGGWVAAARRDWLATFRLLTETAPRHGNWEAALDRALANPAETPGAPIDPALDGLTAAADLINLGYPEGIGPLEPVATATARDLLNFGWEISGTQLAGRYFFLDRKYGDKTSSKPFQQAVIAAVPQLMLFFTEANSSTPTANSSAYERLQRIEASGPALARAPYAAGRNPLPERRAERARNLGVRGWLMTDHLQAAVPALASTQQHQAIAPLLLRAHAEGGRMGDVAALEYLLTASMIAPADSLPSRGARPGTGNRPLVPALSWADRPAIIRTLAERLAPDEGIWRRIRHTELSALPPLERARAYERLFWNDPDDRDYALAFTWYLEAGALASAKRYYDCIAPLFGGSVGFSNGVGPRRTMLALLEGDLPTAQRILTANSTYSFADLTADLMLAAAQHDRRKVESIARAANERYPKDQPGAMMPLMLGFIPLWPALETPGHPDREKALDYFVQSEAWPSFQWFVARQAKLSREETIRFLGGDQAQGERRLMVAYLREDREAFARSYAEMASGKSPRVWSTMAFVLAQWLRLDLFKIAPPPDDPTLSPAQPKTIEQEVREARDHKITQLLEARLATLNTADKLWAHIESLQRPAAVPDRAAWSQNLRDLAEAARLMAERFPQDERSWNARLLRTQLVPQLAMFGDTAPDDAATRRELEAIAAAKAAPRPVRVNAVFALLQLGLRQEQASPDPTARRELAARAEAARREFAGEPMADAFDLITAELLKSIDAEAATAALQRAASSAIPPIAEQARTRLRLQEVFTKPFELKFTAVDGREVDFAKLRGHVVLLDFWATWCPPCVAEMPKLVEFYKTYQPKGLEMVGISLDESKAALTAFVEKNGLGWPQYFDGRGWGNQLSSQWGITAVPTKWLIDQTGHVRPLKPDDDLETEVKTLLAR